jgi:hypothetical protein
LGTKSNSWLDVYCNFISQYIYGIDSSNASPEADGITPAISQQISEPSARSSQALADDLGVSHATIERVRTILEQGTAQQIQILQDRSQTVGISYHTIFRTGCIVEPVLCFVV